MNHRRLMALHEAITRSGYERMDDNVLSADGIVETATAVIGRMKAELTKEPAIVRWARTPDKDEI